VLPATRPLQQVDGFVQVACGGVLKRAHAMPPADADAQAIEASSPLMLMIWPGGAEAALERASLDKGALDRVEPMAGRRT
jgi:hypothetical protein